VEHQLDVGEDLRLEALDRIEAEALVARILDRAIGLGRTFREPPPARRRGSRGDFGRHDLGDQAEPLLLPPISMKAAEQQHLGGAAEADVARQQIGRAAAEAARGRRPRRTSPSGRRKRKSQASARSSPAPTA
jgi:hypothetical protein